MNTKLTSAIYIAALALLTTTIFAPAILHLQSIESSAVVSIGSDGVVSVSVKAVLPKGLNTLRLPVEPIVSTIVVVGDGLALPAVYDNGTLYTILDKDMSVEVSYIANTSIDKGIFYLNIETEDTIELRVPLEVLLLTWPEQNIVDVALEDNVLVLYIKGPATIRYTLKVPITSTPISSPTPVPSPITPSPSVTPTPSTSSTPSTPSSTSSASFTQAPPHIPLWIIGVIIAVAVGVAVGALYFYIRRRGSTTSIVSMLSDIDYDIIKALEAKGGSALQTELQEMVKIPRTTLWRHIRKLEKLGIVKVEKVGLQNKVTLIKKVQR